jgi:hypothetical protein
VAGIKWRVQAGVVDPDQTEEARGLVQLIIRLGMELLRDINWHDGSPALLSMIAVPTGVDLAV